MGEVRGRLRVDVSRRTTALVVAALALSLTSCAEPRTTSGAPAAPSTPTDAAPSTPEPSPTAPTPTPTLSPSASPAVAPASEPARGTPLAATAALGVKGRAARPGFDRAQVRPARVDADRRGCDTSTEVRRSSEQAHEGNRRG